MTVTAEAVMVSKVRATTIHVVKAASASIAKEAVMVSAPVAAAIRSGAKAAMAMATAVRALAIKKAEIRSTDSARDSIVIPSRANMAVAVDTALLEASRAAIVRASSREMLKAARATVGASAHHTALSLITDIAMMIIAESAALSAQTTIITTGAVSVPAATMVPMAVASARPTASKATIVRTSAQAVKETTIPMQNTVPRSSWNIKKSTTTPTSQCA